MNLALISYTENRLNTIIFLKVITKIYYLKRYMSLFNICFTVCCYVTVRKRLLINSNLLDL